MAEVFGKGEELWLGGRKVIFLEYHRSASPRVGAAVVRRLNEEGARVVPLWKLARDRAESIARTNAIPAQLTGSE
jgi:hypothetical protein